jgi:hypothetical protein
MVFVPDGVQLPEYQVQLKKFTIQDLALREVMAEGIFH